MPSDVAYLVGTAIAGAVLPAAAAYVTLKIHKERLLHERRLEDFRALREVAAEGAAILRQPPQDDFHRWLAAATESGGKEPALPFPGLESLNVLGDYSQRLSIWFPDHHPVARRWGDVVRANQAFAFRDSDASMEEVAELLRGFYEAKAAWFEVVRASIGPGSDDAR
jgi:hypothetical protein